MHCNNYCSLSFLSPAEFVSHSLAHYCTVKNGYLLLHSLCYNNTSFSLLGQLTICLHNYEWCYFCYTGVLVMPARTWMIFALDVLCSYTSMLIKTHGDTVLTKTTILVQGIIACSISIHFSHGCLSITPCAKKGLVMRKCTRRFFIMKATRDLCLNGSYTIGQMAITVLRDAFYFTFGQWLTLVLFSNCILFVIYVVCLLF